MNALLSSSSRLTADDKRVLISIIIPVYNTAPYLRACLESVFSSTLQDIEVIAIDDVSTDDSYKILKTFTEKDKRLRLYQLSHHTGFPAQPRNKGIKEARGKYIAFVDSDDLISPKLLEAAYKRMEQYNADMGYSNRVSFANGSHTIIGWNHYDKHLHQDGSPIFNASNASEDFYKNMNGYNCFTIFNRQFMAKNKLYYEHEQVHEDLVFFMQVIYYAQKIVHIPKHLYYYRRGRNKNTTNNLTLVYSRYNIQHIKEMSMAFECVLMWLNQQAPSVRRKQCMEMAFFQLFKQNHIQRNNIWAVSIHLREWHYNNNQRLFRTWNNHPSIERTLFSNSDNQHFLPLIYMPCMQYYYYKATRFAMSVYKPHQVPYPTLRIKYQLRKAHIRTLVIDPALSKYPRFYRYIIYGVKIIKMLCNKKSPIYISTEKLYRSAYLSSLPYNWM